MRLSNDMGRKARVVLAGTAIAALAGCTSATPPSAADRTPAPASPSASPVPSESPVTVLETVAGLPPGITESPLPPEHSPVPLAFTDPVDARVLWISSWGSSSCPTIPTAYSLSADGALTLTVEPDHSKAVISDGHAVCTADLALVSTSITLPDNVEIPADVTLQEYEVVTIPVRPDPAE